MADRRYPRTARVNELVREVLAEELERLSDPKLGFVTLTGVDVTGDLRQATVWYSVLDLPGYIKDADPDQVHEDTADALRAITGHLKSVLGRQVRLKYTPDLLFREDPAMTEADRVERILRQLHAGENAEDSG
ncbi:MAG: 30S ribosome-binding factor RbfA [Actinomycetota bacterium]|nr:30S ribosome-binding factor RbfA [Actinomycetota bacterium]